MCIPAASVSTRMNPFPRYSFFFNDTATTEIYTLSLHDALPIWGRGRWGLHEPRVQRSLGCAGAGGPDRKSTRLNSSHRNISYAVFCLKKKCGQGDSLRKQSALSLRATYPAAAARTLHCCDIGARCVRTRSYKLIDRPPSSFF